MSEAHEDDVPLPDRPLRDLAVHVGEGCGPDCSYCLTDAWAGRLVPPPRLEPDQAQELVRSMVRGHTAVHAVSFFGGEPLENLPAIGAAIDAIGALHDAGRLSGVPRFRVVSPMSVATPEVLDFVNQHRLAVTGRIDGPDTTRLPARGRFATVDRSIRRMRAHTGEPSELEVFYGPKHANRGLSMVDLHRFLAERYGVGSVVLYPLYPDPDCPPELADVRERMFQHAAEYHRFRSGQP